MGVMRLSRFFERFDSARDKLERSVYECLGGGMRPGNEVHSAVDLSNPRYSRKNMFRESSFRKRKYDVFVLCRNLCYVPKSLMRDIKSAGSK